MASEPEILKVYIVDDEPKAIETLAEIVNSFVHGAHVVGSANTIDRAFTEINALGPNLVFVDVEMGDVTGFQLLEQFDKINFHIAFVTAHEEFALRAIKFSAIDYIIKPASISELRELIAKIQERPKLKDENPMVNQMFGNLGNSDFSTHKITIPTSEGYEFIRIKDIYHVRADGSYAVLKLTDGNALVSSRNLKHYTSMLEEYGFYRIHNSTLINLDYIKKLNKAAGGSVVMEDNEEFSISKSRKDAFLELLSIK
ncbi:MAG: response regulator transcription factor [Bacteroidia bacterium]|nr:response regulator transcription factor [Bacteroidia bacterium]